MSFETVVLGVSDSAVKKAENLLRLYHAGDLSRDLFVELMSMLVDQSRGRGAAAAVQVLQEYLEIALEDVRVMSPQIPATDFDRLTTAANTIFESELDTGMQFERLVRGEVTAAAQRAYENTLQRLPEVSGWTRGLDSKACELCRWWWREGRVWSKNHPMPRHTGCVCHQVPIVTRTENYQTEQQAARTAAKKGEQE